MLNLSLLLTSVWNIVRHEVEVDGSVRFVATANVGIEYSATRTIDRALQDRFISFNIPYLKGQQVKSYVRKVFGSEVSNSAAPLFKIYDYTHKMFREGKLSDRLSTRMVLEVMPLVNEFTLSEILDNVILSLFQQDSSAILNDANIIREYADSLGVYNNASQANG